MHWTRHRSGLKFQSNCGQPFTAWESGTLVFKVGQWNSSGGKKFNSLKNTAWYNLLTFRGTSGKVNVSLDHQSKIFRLSGPVFTGGDSTAKSSVPWSWTDCVERKTNEGEIFFFSFFWWWETVHCMLEFVFPSFSLFFFRWGLIFAFSWTFKVFYIEWSFLCRVFRPGLLVLSSS